MGCQSEVMHCYEQIAPITEQMLVLARSGQWGELPPLETQQSDYVERLRSIEPAETLNESQVARKYHLLSRITAHQAEISSIVMPQLMELGKIIKNLAQQHLLHNAYSWTNEPVS
ncbi:MAG: flagellar protein FliT [Rhodoferax sp.]